MANGFIYFWIGVFFFSFANKIEWKISAKSNGNFSCHHDKLWGDRGGGFGVIHTYICIFFFVLIYMSDLLILMKFSMNQLLLEKRIVFFLRNKLKGKHWNISPKNMHHLFYNWVLRKSLKKCNFWLVERLKIYLNSVRITKKNIITHGK